MASFTTPVRQAVHCMTAEFAPCASSIALQGGLIDMQRQQAVVDCPRSMVGRVIGKSGETIKALQQYTGAMIQIDQSVEPTKVTVAGSPQSLQLAVSMIRDIVAGNFKGFALLRQLTNGTGFQSAPGFDQLSQARPVYVEGYGFVPPSQADLLRGAAMPGEYGAPSINPTAIPAMPLGLLGNALMGNPLMGMPQSLGLLSLPSGQMVSVGAVDKAHPGNGYTEDSLSRSGLSSIGNAGAASSVPAMAHTGAALPFNGQAAANSLPYGWISMADPEGRLFYFNGLTGQAQWNAPSML